MLLNFRALDITKFSLCVSLFDGCCQCTAADYYRADSSFDIDPFREVMVLTVALPLGGRTKSRVKRILVLTDLRRVLHIASVMPQALQRILVFMEMQGNLIKNH